MCITSQLSLNYDDEHPTKARAHVTSDKTKIRTNGTIYLKYKTTDRVQKIQKKKKHSHNTFTYRIMGSENLVVPSKKNKYEKRCMIVPDVRRVVQKKNIGNR